MNFLVVFNLGPTLAYDASEDGNRADGQSLELLLASIYRKDVQLLYSQADAT